MEKGNNIELQPPQKIDSFSLDYDFLSNFYMTDVVYEGLKYTNSESAFQAQKSMDIEDKLKFIKLVPGKAKRLGRKIKLRPDWEEEKDRIMYEIVKAKFMQHPYLRDKLLETGDTYLEEGNTWGDAYWGVDKRTGEGQNKLGHILMRLRTEFRGGVKWI